MDIILVSAMALASLLMYLVSIRDPLPDDRCCNREHKFNRRHRYYWNKHFGAPVKMCKDCGKILV